MCKAASPNRLTAHQRIPKILPLEIIAEDVLAIEELPSLPQQCTNGGIAVRLTVKHGFRLANLSSAAADEQRLWKTRRPFAIVTRAPKAPLQDDGSYAEREQAFLRSRGIELQP